MVSVHEQSRKKVLQTLSFATQLQNPLCYYYQPYRLFLQLAQEDPSHLSVLFLLASQWILQSPNHQLDPEPPGLQADPGKERIVLAHCVSKAKALIKSMEENVQCLYLSVYYILFEGASGSAAQPSEKNILFASFILHSSPQWGPKTQEVQHSPLFQLILTITLQGWLSRKCY